MKKILAILLLVAVLFSGCDVNALMGQLQDIYIPTSPAPTDPDSTIPDATNPPPTGEPTAPPPTGEPPVDKEDCTKHTDTNDDGYCDSCFIPIIVDVDLFSINDLHGKLADGGSNHPGVDELTTYLKNAQAKNENTILLSGGDMWQGAAESNLTNGNIITDWMNDLNFAAMVLGNHEYDWGSEQIRVNNEIAQFPFLAINVYDKQTNKRVDYCEASVVIEASGVQIGIIGAIGDCYSSIAVDKCRDVTFKKESALTALIKEESNRLRAQGVDFVVYIIHDGYDSTIGSSSSVSDSYLYSDYENKQVYYDTTLSNGYVDLVFEGHTHQGYNFKDKYGVYHLQNKGDNKGGISHVKVTIDAVTNTFTIQESGQIAQSKYQNLADDAIVAELLEKYENKISKAYEVLGNNKTTRNSNYLCQLVADLYCQFGQELWGEQYDIVLGGGFIKARSPYNIYAGNVTYGDVYDVFPFDNDMTLCTIKGSDLLSKFINTTNTNYYIDYTTYGEGIKNSIQANKTYYVVVDSYTAYYSYNNLTVVETYDGKVFARDLLAEYIREGGLAK